MSALTDPLKIADWLIKRAGNTEGAETYKQTISKAKGLLLRPSATGEEAVTVARSLTDQGETVRQAEAAAVPAPAPAATTAAVPAPAPAAPAAKAAPGAPALTAATAAAGVGALANLGTAIRAETANPVEAAEAPVEAAAEPAAAEPAAEPAATQGGRTRKARHSTPKRKKLSRKKSIKRK